MNKKIVSALFVAVALVAAASFVPAHRASADENGNGEGESNGKALQGIGHQIGGLVRAIGEGESSNEGTAEPALTIDHQGNADLSGAHAQSVSGTTLGVNVFGITLTVDASNATVADSQGGASVVPNIHAGDTLGVKGTINTTTGIIAASRITDFSLAASNANTSALEQRIQQLFTFLAQLQAQLAALGGGTTTTATFPVISNITVGNVASTTAAVLWMTNVPATSKVFYSTVSPVPTATASSTSDTALATNHALTLTGLIASTTYSFVVQSADASNNTVSSSQGSFTTGQ